MDKIIKIKPDDVKSGTYINFGIKNNEEDLKFKLTDHVRISKYKNIFAKGYATHWSEEVFVIKQVKNAVPWTYGIEDLNGEKIVRTVYKKELLKTNQEELRVRVAASIFLRKKGVVSHYFLTDCSLKSDVDKLDIGKLVPTPADLSQLCSRK